MYSGVLKNKEGVGGSKVLSFSFSDENTEKDNSVNKSKKDIFLSFFFDFNE